jgi:hypothetical protein
MGPRRLAVIYARLTAADPLAIRPTSVRCRTRLGRPTGLGAAKTAPEPCA